MPSTLLDTKLVATRLQLSVQQVRNLCRTGKIPASRIGARWLIDAEIASKYYDHHSCGIAHDQSNNGQSMSRKTNKPIALSFFSGAMGLDLGLEAAGFEVVLCSEIDNACRKTILKNRPNVSLIGDIRDYSAKNIRDMAGLAVHDDIDLVVGGPPCQAFSTAGKRQGFEDERGNVFLTFLEIIEELRPKYAIIENVRGILSAPLRHRPHNRRGFNYPPLEREEQNGGALFHIVSRLRKAGYGVSFNLYNAANFGTPQKRERVIIACSRDGNPLPYLTPTHSENGAFGLPKWKTFRQATMSLPKGSHNHLQFPEKRLKYYRLLKPGEYWRNLPKHLQEEALGKSYLSGGGKTGFLRRLAWDRPSPTLVTHPAMPATDLAHPCEDRPLSIEEYKRIQEFPDNWQIEGSLIEQYRQIGNAVPVSLGKAVGQLVLSHMRGETSQRFPDFRYSRYTNTDEKSWERVFLAYNSAVENTLGFS